MANENILNKNYFKSLLVKGFGEDTAKLIWRKLNVELKKNLPLESYKDTEGILNTEDIHKDNIAKLTMLIREAKMIREAKTLSPGGSNPNSKLLVQHTALIKHVINGYAEAYKKSQQRAPKMHILERLFKEPKAVARDMRNLDKKTVKEAFKKNAKKVINDVTNRLKRSVGKF